MPEARQPLSCFIRTRNEARRIGRVVEAACKVADEVLVIDSGSTDDTVVIAEAAGARVIHHDWPGHGRQKRFGEDACANDWLLDLDADEVLTEELQTEIRALLADGPPPKPVYFLKLITVPPVGKPWPFDYLVKPRLYDRRVARAPDHEVWDQLEIPSGVQTGRLTHTILHYSTINFEQLVAKLNWYTSRLAEGGRLKPLPVVTFRLIFAFPFYFFRAYILRRLFLGGRYGFAFAVVGAFGRWLRDAKMLERHLTGRNGPSS